METQSNMPVVPPVNSPVTPPVSVNPPASPSLPTSPVVPPSTPTQAQSKPQRSMVAYILIALLLVVVGLAAFYLVNVVSTPAKIKEKVELMQPVFEKYSQTMKKIGDYLKEENAQNDSDSLERELEKGKNLLKNAENDKGVLESSSDKTDLRELSFLKKSMQEYLTKTNELLTLQKDSIQMLDVYLSVLKEYEELVVNITGISNYMYSDPDKYLKGVGDFISKDKNLIKKLEEFNAKESVRDIHKAIIKRMQLEVELFEEIKTAVEMRSTAKITQAQKKYAQNLLDNEKELNRYSDKFDEIVKDKIYALEALGEKIQKEFQRLRTVYKI